MRYHRNSVSDKIYEIPLHGDAPERASDLPYLPGQDHGTHMEMPLSEFVAGVQIYKGILEEAARPYIILTGHDALSQEDQDVAVVYPVADPVDDLDDPRPKRMRQFNFSRGLSDNDALRFLFNTICDCGGGDVMLFHSSTAQEPFGVLRSYITREHE
jgi:hypothetical protein